MGTALIFGSAPCGEWGFLEGLRGRCSVICADGGLRLAREAGFAPDVYVGDGDSGGGPCDGVVSVVLPPEKDLTDLQAAYEYARDRGFETVIFTACTGGRQDHHLANLALLERVWEDGLRAFVLDRWNEIRFHPGGRLRLPAAGYRYFSILPMDGRLRQVRISGGKYPLDVPEVRRGDSLTVSNEPEGPVTIEIGEGAAWIVRSERNAPVDWRDLLDGCAST